MDVVGIILSSVGIIVSGAGLGITWYTLKKVKRVEEIQRTERSLTQELLDVDEIEADIKKVIEKFKLVGDEESSNLASDLSRRLGAIEGTRRVLGAYTDKKTFLQIEYGFFSDEHLDVLIGNCKKSLDLMTGSTRLISGYYKMDKIKKICKKGVQVRIIGIDPDAEDDILEDAAKTVSRPAPKSASEYRKLMKNNQKEIIKNVSEWENDSLKSKFQYKSLKGVPRVSFAKCDDTICLGFLQFYRDAQPNDMEKRHYLRIPKDNDLSEVIMKHFEIGWKEAKSIF